MTNKYTRKTNTRAEDGANSTLIKAGECEGTQAQPGRSPIVTCKPFRHRRVGQGAPTPSPSLPALLATKSRSSHASRNFPTPVARLSHCLTEETDSSWKSLCVPGAPMRLGAPCVLVVLPRALLRQSGRCQVRQPLLFERMEICVLGFIAKIFMLYFITN